MYACLLYPIVSYLYTFNHIILRFKFSKFGVLWKLFAKISAPLMPISLYPELHLLPKFRILNLGKNLK